MAQPDIWLRLGAALAAIVLLPFAFVSAALALGSAAFAAQAPDAFAPEADPCCSPPQTWGEVWLAAAFAVPAVAVAAVLCAAVVSFAMTVAVERGLRRRTIARAPLIPLAILAVVVPIGWIVDEPHLRAARDGMSSSRQTAPRACGGWLESRPCPRTSLST